MREKFEGSFPVWYTGFSAAVFLFSLSCLLTPHSPLPVLQPQHGGFL